MVSNISFYSFLIFLSINNFIYGKNISVIYPKELIKVGDKVEIICSGENIKPEDIKLGRSSSQMVGKCELFFDKSKYSLECKNNQLKFTINKFDLNDNNKWSCSNLGIITEFNLRGYDAGKINVNIKGYQTKAPSDIIGPELMPQSNQNFIYLNGRGKKSNPYDLRKNLSIEVTCDSVCVYPKLNHTLILENKSNNVSITRSFLLPTIQKCDKNRYTITNKMLFKCVDFNLKGVVKMSCNSHRPYNNKVLSQNSFYILCPTKPIEWWLITMGEKVLTAIGCLIGIMLLLLLFLLVCRWKTNKYRDLDDCHNSNSVGGVLSGKQENGCSVNDSQVIRGYRV